MIHDGRMNALYTAIRFLEPMKRGVNRPMRIQGESQEDGKRTDIVLKCRAGYADAPECLLREHVAYQLARRLGITTPEPVWVYVPEGFSWSAAEYETHRELLERSVGWNFGTVYLGNEWKPWISRDCAKKIPRTSLENAYVFDAMVQNADRHDDNPNLLWKRDQLMVLDFDQAYAYLRGHGEENRPWRSVLPMMNLKSHCLHSDCSSRIRKKTFGKTLWETWEEWRVGEAVEVLTQGTHDFFADEKLDIPLMFDYHQKLSVALDDFFDWLRAHS